jgi:septal ring factor EnvC (AmiA/AmiB activator)
MGVKTVIIALALRSLVLAAEPSAPSSATTEERLRVAQKQNELLNQEIAFEEQRIEAITAQIAAYEKALLAPANSAKQALDAETAQIAKAHRADGCQMRTDGAWEKCPPVKK